MALIHLMSNPFSGHAPTPDFRNWQFSGHFGRETGRKSANRAFGSGVSQQR
jgi:hypothetical protein